jgi:ribonuclease HII
MNTRERHLSIEALFAYEKELYEAGAHTIVCIDEVGRGAIAGPVSAAAVVLGADWQVVDGVADSKVLSPKRRQELAEKLAGSVQSFHVAHVEASFIDESGIMCALRHAMKSAVAGLKLDCEPDHILIDGNPMRLFPQEEAIVKGDGRIAGIAAASILAKVSRDALMCELSSDFEPYDFASNKGYASVSHQSAIAMHGLTPLHRKSFCRNFVQESLF